MPTTRVRPERYKHFAGNYGSNSLIGWNPPSGGPADAPDNYYVIENADDTVTYGDNVSNWRQRIAQGKAATTTLVGERKSWQRGLNRRRLWQHFTLPNGYTYESWWFHDNGLSSIQTSAPSSALISKVNSQASQKFYKQVEEVYNAFQGGVFLGELGESLRMIRSPAKALRQGIDKYLHAVQRHRKLKLADKRKAIADTYLEYAFGWAPLANDIADAANYLQKRRDQLQHDTRVITATASGEETTFTNSAQRLYQMRNTLEVLTKKTYSVRYKAGLNTSQYGTSLLGAKALGFHPTSFLPTVWELLPWSFLIDYFTNVGEVVSSFANRKTKLCWGVCTTRTTVVAYNTKAWITWADTEYGATVYARSDSGGSLSSTSYTSVNRQPVTSVPIPDLHFEVPGMGMKWLNIASLAASRRKLTPF